MRAIGFMLLAIGTAQSSHLLGEASVSWFDVIMCLGLIVIGGLLCAKETS